MTAEEYSTHVKGIIVDDTDEDENTTYMVDSINSDIFGWSRNFRGFIQYREIIEEW